MAEPKHESVIAFLILCLDMGSSIEPFGENCFPSRNVVQIKLETIMPQSGILFSNQTIISGAVGEFCNKNLLFDVGFLKNSIKTTIYTYACNS